MEGSFITAQEARRLTLASDGVERLVAEEIMKRVDSSIRNATREGNSSVPVVVPPFLYGSPAFDRERVYSKVETGLKKHGFKLSKSPVEAYALEVSWGSDICEPEDDGITSKEQMKQASDAIVHFDMPTESKHVVLE